MYHNQLFTMAVVNSLQTLPSEDLETEELTSHFTHIAVTTHSQAYMLICT